MPRLKKITLDASNGRVIESKQNPRLARKPIFYAGEAVSVSVDPVEVSTAGNDLAYETIKPDKDNPIMVRLGTTTTLVAQGTTFSYTPPPRYQATVSIVTAASSAITCEAEWIKTNSGRFLFEFKSPGSSYAKGSLTFPAVTAQFRAVMSYYTSPAVTVSVPMDQNDAFYYPGLEVFVAGTCVTFSAAVNNPSAASFTVTTVADAVTSIGISSGGSGYPDGTYSLTFVGGTVTSVAQASCVASCGSIISVTVVTGGSGYVTKPSVSLFTPARQITAVNPSITLAVVNDRPRFHWHLPLDSGTAITLSISAPTSTSTPVTAVPPVVRMQYVTQDAEGMPVWEINVVCAGYGYVGTPAVSVPAHNVSARRRSTTATVSGNNLTVAVNYDNGISATAEEGSLIPGSDPYHLGLSGPYYDRGGSNVNGRGPFENGAFGADFRPGTYPLITNGNTPDGEAKVVMLPSARGTLGRDVLGYGIGTKPNSLRLEYADGQMTAQRFRELAGRSYICAVIPQRQSNLPNSVPTLNALNETAPERYAIVRITLRDYSGGFPSYYVGQSFFSSNSGSETTVSQGILSKETVNGIAGVSKFAPGGGFFEPTIEFLDYGKGYKTTQFVGTNAHQRFSYNLRVLSGLRTGYVIDETPGGRTITAVTTGTLGDDSFIQTAYSQRATVATRNGDNGVQSFVLNSGFGYQGQGYFTGSAVTMSDKLKRIELTNQPIGYAPGIYSLTVTGGGGSGAAANLVVNEVQNFSGKPDQPTNIYYYVSMVSFGSGYTSSPSVTGPAPSLQSVRYYGDIKQGGGGIKADQAIELQLYASSVVTDPADYDHYLNYSSPTPGVVIRTIKFYGLPGYQLCTRKINPQPYIKKPSSPAGYPVVGPLDFASLGEYESIKWYPISFRNPRPTGILQQTSEREAKGYVCFERNPFSWFGFVHNKLNKPTKNVLEYCGPDPSTIPFSSSNGLLPQVSSKSTLVFQASLLSDFLAHVVITDPGFYYQNELGWLPEPDSANLYTLDYLKSFNGYREAIGISMVTGYANLGNYTVVTFGFSYLGLKLGNYFGSVSGTSIQGQDANVILRVDALDHTDLIAERRNQVANNQLMPWSKTALEFSLNHDKRTTIGQAVFDGGMYATPPSVISFAANSGNYIASVTVTCKGWFYASSDQITADLVNPQGPQDNLAFVKVVTVSNGKIQSVSLINGGHDVGDLARVELPLPSDDPRDIPELQTIKANLSVSAVSANTVLGIQDSADVLLELYETDGSSQHVLAQVPVTLAKRVSST